MLSKLIFFSKRTFLYMKIEQLKRQDYESVLNLWEKLVKVSYTFLKEQDFNIIKESSYIKF